MVNLNVQVDLKESKKAKKCLVLGTCHKTKKAVEHKAGGVIQNFKRCI